MGNLKEVFDLTKEELYARLEEISKKENVKRFFYKIESAEELLLLRELSKKREIILAPITGPSAPIEPIEIQLI